MWWFLNSGKVLFQLQSIWPKDLDLGVAAFEVDGALAGGEGGFDGVGAGPHLLTGAFGGGNFKRAAHGAEGAHVGVRAVVVVFH